MSKLPSPVSEVEQIDWNQILENAKKRALRGGTAGSVAMLLQVRLIF